MGKKGEVAVSEKSEMVPLLLDTMCSRDEGTTTWESMYNLLEGEHPRLVETKATTDT